MQNIVKVSIFGSMGGLMAWLVGELLFGRALSESLSLSQRFTLDAVYGFTTGLIFGLTLGIGHWIHFRRWWLPLFASFLGTVGGVIGLLWGEALYQFLRFAKSLARIIGWSIVGFVLGSSQGAARGSTIGALRSGLGGGIGGGLGGILFALLPIVSHIPDSACRGIAWVLMGFLIGCASVLFERLLAGATLKIASGKLEGKEFILDKPQITIGRDERCDVSIYYDPTIQPNHATLEWTGAGYRIAPVGNASVIVNGQKVPVKELEHNDVVVIGNTRLVYRLRAGSPLTSLCASCYAPNRKDAKFCRSCGQTFVPLDLPKESIAFWLRQAGWALGVLMLCLIVGYCLGSRMGRIKPVVTATMLLQPSNIAKGWQQRPLRLAVTPAGYDDIGEVLRKIGFTVENVGFDVLDDLTRLRHYDAVFVNCHQALKDFYNGQAIASYVANGGILYASDYACSVVKAAFPQVVDFGFSGIFSFFGETVDAEVTDPTLADLMGYRVRLHFDLPAWRHVSRWDSTCRVYLTTRDWFSEKALLVSFGYGQGFVVYTAFHNKGQPSEVEGRLIEFFALRPLTMRLSRQIAWEIARPIEVGTLGEREATGLLAGEQMMMRREIIGTLGSGQSSPIYRFRLSRPSPIKIVVGWEGGAGEFVLTFGSEARPQMRWQQSSRMPPLILDITEALPAGHYYLRLVSVKAPLPKTPFVIGIGLR